jgi:uncharacterized membrane protein YfcA
MPDALRSTLIVAAGAAAAGFLQGLTGFAFSIVALSFWVWALPPQTAAPLAVFGALSGQIASLASVRGGFVWNKIVPLVIGGWLGVPIGALFLHSVDPQRFRLAIGALLTSYALFAIFVRDPGVIKGGGRWLDAAFGLFGGVLGGFGGMSGFVPAIWTQLRGWKRDLRRATMQAYNIAMHIVTIAVYFRTGTLAHADLSQFFVVAPAMLIPSYFGARLYSRFHEKAFTRAVLAALLFSGLALVYSATRALSK